MEWEASKLKTKLHDLEQRVQQVSDVRERTILFNDIAHLKVMLNILEGKKQYSLNSEESSFKILDSQGYINMADYAQTVGPKFADKFWIISNIHHIGSKATFLKKIKKEDAFNLIYEFFSFFDKNLLNLLMKYRSEKRILWRNTSYNLSTCSGRCFPMGTEGSSYVFGKYNGKLSNCITMVHEMGHAEQFENITDVYQIQRLLYTLLGEAYPMFLEYAFIEFLKHTKYRKAAFLEQAQRLNYFLVYMECWLPYFYNIEKANFLEGNVLDAKGFYQHYNELELMLSSMLAMYWNSIYIDDPQRALDEVEQFKEDIIQKPFEEVMSSYSAEKLYEGTLNTFKNYCHNYSKK